MLDIESVFSKERNKTLELLNTGKIFKDGFNKLNAMDEIMYGSATVESDYSFTTDISMLIKSGYAMNLSTFEKLENGTYAPPKSVEDEVASMLDRYANFWKLD